MADFDWTDPNSYLDAFKEYGPEISGALGAYTAYKGTEDQVTKPYYYPGQQEGLTAGMDLARQQAEAGPMSYYPGQTLADQDQNLIAGQNQQLGMIPRLNQMRDVSANSAQQLTQGGADRIGGFTLQDQIGFGIPEEYQSAIMNPIMDNLYEKTLPGLQTAATAQGAFGGSRAAQQNSDAATQATKAATDAMIAGNLQARQQSIGQRAGDISAQLQGRGQDIDQNQLQNQAMQQGVAGMGSAMAQQLIPGQVRQDIGQDRTAYEQAQIAADQGKFDWNRQENIDYIDRLLGRAQGLPPSGEIEVGQSGELIDILSGYGSGSNIWNEINGIPTTGTP